jgi:hypothetical protein
MRSPIPASPGERVAVSAHCLAHLGHLTHRARHHHGAGVLPDAQRITHPDRDRVDVLQRAGHLDTDDVVSGVGPEPLGTEQLSEIGGQLLVGHRQHRRGGIALGHLTRDIRPGQDAGRMSGQDFGDDLRHSHIGALLEALDQRDHRHPRPQFLAQLVEHATKAVRRHPHHDDVGGVGRLGEVGGGSVGDSSTSSPR